MKLEHVAVSISDHREIKDFYHDILGMYEQKTFVLNADLTAEIFGRNEEVTVYLMRKDRVFFEVFISPSKLGHGYSHICLTFDDRENVLRNAEKNGYNTIRVIRETRELTFLRDRDENLFEIKEERSPIFV